jgi:metal-dependent amidase/aminoacylase/carboxypeptidase family protein
MVELRRAIHADPELGLETPRTREKLVARRKNKRDLLDRR